MVHTMARMPICIKVFHWTIHRPSLALSQSATVQNCSRTVHSHATSVRTTRTAAFPSTGSGFWKRSSADRFRFSFDWYGAGAAMAAAALPARYFKGC